MLQIQRFNIFHTVQVILANFGKKCVRICKIWRKLGLAKWQNGKMAKWQNGKMLNQNKDVL